MDLGIAVMVIIILIALAVVAAVMYFGSQHDVHNDIRSAESSRSVQTILDQDEKRNKRLEEIAQAEAKAIAEAEAKTAQDEQQEEKPTAAGKATGKGVEALNDPEAKEKRRQAALARKAARQKAQAESQN